MKVPLNNLSDLHSEIKVELDEAWNDLVERSDFIGGRSINEFELEFAKKTSSNFCIGVANGTDAIEIVLAGLNLKPGDEVILPAQTWISTAEAVSRLGGIPVFADCENNSAVISVSSIKRLINSKTVGIIAVHLHGYEADTLSIRNLVKDKNIWLIEDCAQSHLLNLYSDNVGKYSIACTYSFFPGKNLGAFGDAGAITTNSEDLAEYCRLYANHGTRDKLTHFFPGVNSRLDSIQASILKIKLKKLKFLTDKRISIAKVYKNFLCDYKQLRLIQFDRPCVFHQFVILSKDRDELKNYLSRLGISTGVHYPKPVPLLDAYIGSKGEWGYAESLSREMLSLPIFPNISSQQIEYLLNSIREFYK